MTKILIIGDYPDDKAAWEGKDITGPNESLLYGLLKQSGIHANEVTYTNVIREKPRNNRLESFCGPKSAAAYPAHRPVLPGKYIKTEYLPELRRLDADIERENPNVILALGNLALWATTRKTGIKKHRGSPLPSLAGRKVIPSWPIGSIFRQWELRVVVLSDFGKVAKEKDFPEINRPEHLIYIEPTLPDIEKFYHDRLLGQPFLSLDIETKARTITEVGIGTADSRHCLVIPFWDRLAPDGNFWKTAKEERAAWEWVRRICAEFPLIGQNFSYDMNYLWKTVGIPCPRFLGDTMIQHHSLQPELEKSLGFLASIYTMEASWKFMRTDHSTLKRGDE